MKTDQQIYFLHIHKTAGSSLTAILDSYFQPHEVCSAHQWHQLLAIPPEQLDHYRLFRGHFHYCFHTLLKRMPLYITFLRNPVDRVISRYLHFQRDIRHYLHPRASQMSLQEFLRDPITRAQINNLQVRTLAYDFDIHAVKQAVGKPLTAKLEMEEAINSMLCDLPDEQLLPIARQRLDTFAFVGLTEHFQESLNRLAARFGWLPAEAVRLNTAPETLLREQVSGELIAEIEALNWADIELYEHACTKFASAF